MSTRSPSPIALKRRSTWRLAGFAIVLMVVGLAVISIVLAVQQVQAQTIRAMIQTQVRAGYLANDAKVRFDRELSETLRAVAHQILVGAYESFQMPPGAPVWIDRVYAWDGLRTRILLEPETRDPSLRDLIITRIAGRPLNARRAPAKRIELLYDTVKLTPVVFATMRVSDSTSRPIALAAHVNLPLLKTELIEPLLTADDALEIVPVRGAHAPWAQTMYSAMRFWALQPNAEFIDTQRYAAGRQILASMGLTVLALVTALGAMWFLIRVVRREINLVEMKANFVADVSHELKTPLATIRLFSETLHSGRVTSEEKRQEYYSIILRESARLTNLIDNILDFSKIEAGRREYTLEPIDVVQVVRETYDSYRGVLDHNQFEHSLHVTEPVPRILADRGAIAQVLLNLMSNALKYSDDEKSLSIEITTDVRRDRRGALISVHDRGIGISPEDRSRLFEGFYRATDERVRQRGGTGLGLSLVKHIVEAHKGSLDVESRLVKGSTFRIFFPAADQETPPGVDPESPAKSPSETEETTMDENKGGIPDDSDRV